MMRSVELDFDGIKYTLYENGDMYGKQGKLDVRKNTDGYAVVTVGKKGHRTSLRLHRVVGLNFVDNPNNYTELDHIDRDRMNPSADNLRWVTRVENVRRCKKRNICGSDNPNAKLNVDTVLKVREEYMDGVSQMEISKKYDIPWSTVHNIVIRNTWKYQY